MSLKSDLDKPLTNFMSKRLITIDENENVVASAKKMFEYGIGSLIVTRNHEPVGIVTERDILNKIVAVEKDPRTTRISSIMSTPIQTIEYTAKVGDALIKMIKLGVRRLAIVKDEKVIGLVSQRSIVAGESGKQILLPELEEAEGIRCPYCSQLFEDQKEMSKHIDLIHIGKGLLEGDSRKW
jgi:CBS domain-containing protein